ncbi:SMC-Scp complex subunit ScpB [Breznakiellaceae bacterium SP9]
MNSNETSDTLFETTTQNVSYSGLIEAILFLESDPIEKSVLAKLTGLTLGNLNKALETLELRYAKDEAGLELSYSGGGILIAPKKQYWDKLKAQYGKRNDTKLSRAAMETLSIIAYSQPITRSEIEAIRGVNADAMIRLLLERSLIHETGKKDVPGKPSQYGTTKEFLRLFRLASIENLPQLSPEDAERFKVD